MCISCEWAHNRNIIANIKGRGIPNGILVSFGMSLGLYSGMFWGSWLDDVWVGSHSCLYDFSSCLNLYFRHVLHIVEIFFHIMTYTRAISEMYISRKFAMIFEFFSDLWLGGGVGDRGVHFSRKVPVRWTVRFP